MLHHDRDRSWITDLDLDHPKGTQPKILESIKHIFCGFCSVNVGYRFTSVYPSPHSLDEILGSALCVSTKPLYFSQVALTVPFYT